MHGVDLGESFPTRVYLQILASTQPRTSPVKSARSPRSDSPGCPSADDRSTVSQYTDADVAVSTPASDAELKKVTVHQGPLLTGGR